MLTKFVVSQSRPRPPLTTTEPPAPYCSVPRRMLSDLRDNALAIGMYLLVARLYLVNQAPIPLGRTDVLAFDPNLKAGAVKRAFDRLLIGGWLVGSTAPASTKRHYAPSWGVVGGAVRPWSVEAPALSCPRHLETVRVNRDLLDVGLGRILPHPRHAAEVTRYLITPALSLADLGAYALVAAGMERATPALTTLGLVEGNGVCVVPSALALLQQFARRSGIELSEYGRRKLEGAPTARHGQIGHQIGGVIGELIGSAPKRERPFRASEPAERPEHQPRPTIPGIIRDSSDLQTPPPTPPPPSGGQPVLRQRRAERSKPNTTPVPETDATRLLRAIDVRPAQQIELASMSLTAVETAIADGRARQGVRDLAGWVVYLLRQRRDHGWTPPPPTPRADAPEALGAYFAQLATEQVGETGGERVQERMVAPDAKAALPAPLPAAAQLPSLADMWQDALATLRLRLPREVYGACVRRATLVGIAGDVITIGVTDARLKDALGRHYTSSLQFALSDALGHDVTVRVVLRMLN